jgi:carbon monoxide dehydrogenase subunit G
LKVEGQYRFAASRPQVWELLIDPQALKSCMPGVQRFEEVGPDEYEVTLEVGIAAVKGTYKGKARMADKEPPQRYKLVVEGSGGPGFVKGEGILTLTEDGNETLVAVEGDAQVGGLIASVGQRLIGGVSKQMMGQFFKCMQGQLEARK